MGLRPTHNDRNSAAATNEGRKRALDVDLGTSYQVRGKRGRGALAQSRLVRPSGPFLARRV